MDALKQARAAIQLTPESPHAWVALARAQMGAGEYATMKGTIDKAFELGASSATAWYMRGCIYGAYSKRRESFDSFDQALAIEPAYINALVMRGHNKLDFGDADGARKEFEDAIQANPNCYEGYLGRASLSPVSENQSALKDLDRAIELCDCSETRMAKASSLMSNEQVDEALTSVNRAIELNPRSYFPYLLRGYIHATQGNLELALKDCATAESAAPNNFRIPWNRSLIYEQAGDLASAVAECNESLLLWPENHAVYLRLAFMDYDSPNWMNQILQLGKAIEIRPDDGFLYFYRGQAYEYLDKQQQAEADFAKAKELGYEEPEYDEEDPSIDNDDASDGAHN